MKEELAANEEVIQTKQVGKVSNYPGRPRNHQRSYVSAGGVILVLLLPLATLCLWMLRLLGYLSLPF